MLHVLHIEDQPDIQTILRLSLVATKRFRVDGAPDGQTGIALAGALKPDLILLDYSLPDMNGAEILTALQAQPETARIPVILLTALTDHIDMDQCRALGAIELILKPFSPRTIGNQVEEILAARALLSENAR